MARQANSPIIEMRKVCKAFAKPSGEPLPVLADIDLALREGEILGLLGRSGSGKSTLLRIAGGLITPTSGDVLYRGEPLSGPAEGIAVVFQSFALFPWLTVLENVEAGLDALGMSHDEARRRSMSAIDLIGLDGFQSAYPRELSGGMRQRVGFARAIVIEPVLLLMDEPFSALDVLTAETLRTDFLDLWIERQLPTKSVLLVTHNIEEAVMMCDRILVLSSNPGRIAAEIPVPLPHPRNRLDAEFHNIVDEFYSILTSRTMESSGHKAKSTAVWCSPCRRSRPIGSPGSSRRWLHLRTRVTPSWPRSLTRSHWTSETCSLSPKLFTSWSSPSSRTAPSSSTAAGRVFAQSGTEERKRLFSEHLLRFVPLAAHIRHVLDEREGHLAPRVRFESELEDHLNES